MSNDLKNNLVKHVTVYKNKVINYVKQNRKISIIVGVLIVLLLLYFIFIFNRVNRSIKHLKYHRKTMDLTPLKFNQKVMINNYKLCDFYIASSYRTYLPGQQKFDYSSEKVIKEVLLTGARYIELDVYNKTFCDNTEPVVCNGVEAGNWHFTTELDFDKCMETISSTAFSNALSNTTDPLLLCLNVHLNENLKTADKIAEIIYKMFNHRLLGKKYTYKKVNIAIEPIKNLMGKVVIICSGDYKGSKLEELTNFDLKTHYVKNYANSDINKLYNPTDIVEYNKQNLTRIIPEPRWRATRNYDPKASWDSGCQIVCINYQYNDKYLQKYISKFQKCSFILKPVRLRNRSIVKQ